MKIKSTLIPEISTLLPGVSTNAATPLYIIFQNLHDFEFYPPEKLCCLKGKTNGRMKIRKINSDSRHLHINLSAHQHCYTALFYISEFACL